MKRVVSVLFILCALTVGVLAGPAPATATEKTAQPQVEVLVLPAGQKLALIASPFIITRPMTPTDRPQVYTVYKPVFAEDGNPLTMVIVVMERGPATGAEKAPGAEREEIVLPAGRKLVSANVPLFTTRPMGPREKPVTYTVGRGVCDGLNCSLKPIATIREQKK